MDQEEVWIAVGVQLDHTAPQLSFLLTSLVVMEHTQIQRDMMNVFSVLQDLSVLILLLLQCPVKMGHLATLDLHSVPFAQQGTGKSSGGMSCWFFFRAVKIMVSSKRSTSHFVNTLYFHFRQHV